MKKGMAEKALLSNIQLQFKHWRLFRNNVGKAWQGQIEKIKKTLFLLKNPRIVHFGLVKGSGDLVGWRTIKITESMVGKNVAQFVSIEAKTYSDSLKKHQKDWLKIVNLSGGVAMVAKERMNGEIEYKVYRDE